jgi:hypothetical protein
MAADSSTTARAYNPVTSMEREKRLRAAAAAALAYLAVAVLWAAPASLSPADAVPDLGDPVHLSYVMAWDAHQIVRRPWALFESNSFYPYPHSLAFGDHLLPEALAVAPVFWATGNAVLASNVAVLLALTLSALAMFLLVRRLTGSAAAGFLAGLAYAFNSFTRNELPRVHVLNIQWWPLALLFLDRFVRAGKRRDAWALAACLVVQGLSGTYYLVYTALLAPLWIVVVYASEGRWPRRGELRVLALALGVCALPALVVLLPYFVQMRSMAFEKGLEPGVDILSYLAPLRSFTLWGRLAPAGVPGPGSHFAGYLTLALSAFGALRWREGGSAWARRAALATAALGFALSLGFTMSWHGAALAPGPYRLLYWGFPPARGMAGPERIGVLVPFGLAILVGLGAAALLARLRGGARLALLVAMAIVLPLEHWRPARPAFFVPSGRELPAAYAWLAADSRAPMIDLPLYPDVARKFYAVYLNLSTHHFRPIPIGRTSFYPPIHDLLAWYLADFPDPASLSLLERLGVRDVAVHPRAWEDVDERLLRLEALRVEPRLHLVKQFDDTPPSRYDTLNLGEESVYRFSGPPLPLDVPCTPAEELSRGNWALAASGEGDPELVRDGNRATAWRIGPPQRPGDGLEVELPQAQSVAAVALDLYYPYGEFPRNLKLMARENERWERIDYADGPAERWATIRSLLERPREASLVLRFAPRRVTRLRLAIGGREGDASWPIWSLPELHLYAACR